jgi:hypothetical protein
MSLLDVVRVGVAIANQVTAPLQALVSHEASHLSADGFSTRTYDPPVLRPAIVDWKQKHLRTMTGDLTVSRASVIFLDPTVIVDDHDRLILPDGTTGPILDMSGFIDAGTGHPILTEVWLG